MNDIRAVLKSYANLRANYRDGYCLILKVLNNYSKRGGIAVNKIRALAGSALKRSLPVLAGLREIETGLTLLVLKP